ncbi:MAG: hypothetical protein PHD32_03030 [Eubacteriales bacterium]|nr:hypothetical protein [Eubacteriales bacterium]
MKKEWMAGAAALALLMGGCGAQAKPAETPVPTAAPAVWQGISPNARVTWEKTYTKCGHSHCQTTFVESEMVGKSLQDYAAYHLGYAVQGDFDSITLSRYIYQYCPDHYVIMDDGGVLALFRNETGESELTRICRLRYQASDLPEDIRPLVYEGIPYGDISELETMLKQVSAAKMAASAP